MLCRQTLAQNWGVLASSPLENKVNIGQDFIRYKWRKLVALIKWNDKRNYTVTLTPPLSFTICFQDVILVVAPGDGETWSSWTPLLWLPWLRSSNFSLGPPQFSKTTKTTWLIRNIECCHSILKAMYCREREKERESTISHALLWQRNKSQQKQVQKWTYCQSSYGWSSQANGSP